MLKSIVICTNYGKVQTIMYHNNTISKKSYLPRLIQVGGKKLVPLFILVEHHSPRDLTNWILLLSLKTKYIDPVFY